LKEKLLRMATPMLGRYGVIVVIFLIKSSSQSTPTDLASQLLNIGSQLQELGNHITEEVPQKMLELQTKIEELETQNRNKDVKIQHLEELYSELEDKVTVLEEQCGGQVLKETTSASTGETILLVGGFTDSDPDKSTTVTVLNTENCTVSPLPLDTQHYDSVSVGGLSIVCGGDTSAECYSLMGRSWLWHSSMTVARNGHSMVSIPGVGIFSFGGRSRESKSTSDFLAEGFNTWIEGSDIPGDGVADACAVALNSTHIFLAGGFYDKRQVRVYDVNMGLWTNYPSLSFPINNHACIKIDSGVLISGGFTRRDTTAQTLIYSFDNGGQAEPVGSLNVARESHKMVEVDGKVLAIGGENDDGRIGVIEIYDPKNNDWTIVEDSTLSDPRASFVVLSVPLPSSEFCA